MIEQPVNQKKQIGIFWPIIVTCVVWLLIFKVSSDNLRKNSAALPQTSANKQYTATPTPSAVEASTPSESSPSEEVVTPQILDPAPEQGFKQYKDSSLKYGFNFPQGDTVQESTDSVTVLIKEVPVRVDGLQSYYFAQPDPKVSLMSNDLYCETSNATGSRRCRNDKIDEFINQNGFKGYKILRTLTVAGNKIGAGIYQDVVYVFPLKTVAKENDLTEYAGVLFSVRYVSQPNLALLDKIAKSFFWTN